jgi:hypothetical protein
VEQIPERLKKTRATQVEKYGGEEGFRAEMRRRRSMMKSKTGFALVGRDKVIEAQLKSAKARSTNAKKNRTQEKDSPKSDS